MLLVQDDEVIEALSAECSDHSFDDDVRLWRVHRRGDGIDTDPSGPLAEVAAIAGIAIVEQMAWLVAPGRRFDHLPPDPGCGWVCRDVHVHQFPAAVGDEHQDVQRLEREGLDSEQVRRLHLRRVVGQERPPGLAGWARGSAPAITLDRALRDHQPQFQ